MFLSINGPYVDEFDTPPHIVSWMSKSYGTGKRHKKHKTNQSKHGNVKKESIHKTKKKKKMRIILDLLLHKTCENAGLL